MSEKMLSDFLARPCPDHLEDEAYLIETIGEMPEVALAESLLHLGKVEPEVAVFLQAAAARGYLRLVRRDLDHGAVGQAHFRGLQRAGENLARLRGFLAKLGVPGAVLKRRREEEGSLVLEALDASAKRVVGRATLPLMGPSEKEDPANRDRAEMVWVLVPLTPA